MENQVASISTRTTEIVHAVANQMTTGFGIPKDYQIDMTPFIKRPFYLGQVTWADTATKYSFLPTPVTHLPADVILSNLSLRNAVRVGALMKPSLEIHLSLNGTLTHAGCLLIGILPPGVLLNNANTNNVDLINSILSGPHVKMFANEATSAVLQVPWYCNTDMCVSALTNHDDPTQGDTHSRDTIPLVNWYIAEARDRGTATFATLACMVLNPLRPGLGSSSLTVTMEGIFTNFELSVPTPRFINENEWIAQSGKPLWKKATSGLLDIGATGAKTLYPIFGDAIDMARGAIRSLTGLHNFNIPVISDRMITTWNNFMNASDIPQYFEKMDHSSQFNRICKEPVFGTSFDEMNIGYITSKRQYLGSFEVTTSMPAGTVLWSRPISPFQGGSVGPQPYYVSGSVSKQERVCANNLELMHALHRYWRGDLSVTLEVVMNNKTHIKLKVIKYYKPSRYVLNGKLPTMQSLSNCPSQLLEFSAGAQRYCVDLPYLADNELMPCAEDTITEGMFHGMYIIYLAQPMIIGDSSPTSATVNVYMKGEQDKPGSNLQFYGYAHKSVALSQVTPGAYDYHQFAQTLMMKPSVDSEVALSTPLEGGGQDIFEPRWEPQSGGSQSCMPSCTVPMNKPQEQRNDFNFTYSDKDIEHYDRLQPNVDIRPLIRRMYEVYRESNIAMTAQQTLTVVLPLASFVGETIQGLVTPPLTNQYRNLALISSMYHGKSCVGFKMRVEYKATKNVETKVYYIPPGITSNKTPFLANLSYAHPNPGVFAPDTEYVPPLMLASNDKSVDSTRGSFEFLIPDMNPFKFVGGPNKYRTRILTQSSPFEDMGHLYIRVYSEKFDESAVPGDRNYLQLDVFAGLTDESRLGFHTIAPSFTVQSGNKGTYAISTYANTGTPTANTLMLLKSMYKGHPNAG